MAGVAFLYESELRIAAELTSSRTELSRFVYGTQVNAPEYMERGGTRYHFRTRQVQYRWRSSAGCAHVCRGRCRRNRPLTRKRVLVGVGLGSISSSERNNPGELHTAARTRFHPRVDACASSPTTDDRVRCLARRFWVATSRRDGRTNGHSARFDNDAGGNRTAWRGCTVSRIIEEWTPERYNRRKAGGEMSSISVPRIAGQQKCACLRMLGI